MILYHGTNLVINEIDLSVCRPYKDFGRGFYLTTIEDQARKMARRVAAIFGGEPIMNVYSVPEDVFYGRDLNIRRFDKPSITWAMFVTNNRTGNNDGENNFDCKYDIVIGPVADDDLALLFRQFTSGMIDKQSLMRGMEFRKLTDQYSFHTARAVNYLKKERDYRVEA